MIYLDEWVAQGREMPDEALAVFLADRGYIRRAVELERQIARRTRPGPSDRPLALCPDCGKFTANLSLHILDACTAP